MTRSDNPELAVPGRRLGAAYGAGSLALTAVAVITAPWGLLALWPSTALAAWAAAYLGLILYFRKKGGYKPVELGTEPT